MLPLSLRARSRRVLRKITLADYREGYTEGLRKLSIDRSKTVQRLNWYRPSVQPTSDFSPLRCTGYWCFRRDSLTYGAFDDAVRSLAHM